MMFGRQTSNTIGETAETLASEFLQKKGFRVITRNYKVKVGEIDLIMQNNQYLVFVEVKARKSQRYGHPAEYVTTAKQKKIIHASMIFLQKNKALADCQCRFDVITLSSLDSSSIEWIQDAFQT